MLKKIIIPLIILFTFSCNLFVELKNVYPENISIENYGTLNYNETLFNNSSIESMFLDGNKLWFNLSSDFGGSDSIYSYDLTTKTPKRYITESIINDGPTLCGNYVIFKASGNSGPSILKLINKDTGTISTKEFPKTDSPYIYVSGTTIYIKHWGMDFDFYYKSLDFGSTWTVTTMEEYNLNEPNSSSDIVTDNKGVKYRIVDESYGSTKTFLEVSVDGSTWHRSNLGTNFGRDIVVVGDYVYISCNWYYESHIGILPGPHTGGGIQVLKWNR